MTLQVYNIESCRAHLRRNMTKLYMLFSGSREEAEQMFSLVLEGCKELEYLELDFDNDELPAFLPALLSSLGRLERVGIKAVRLGDLSALLECKRLSALTIEVREQGTQPLELPDLSTLPLLAQLSVGLSNFSDKVAHELPEWLPRCVALKEFYWLNAGVTSLPDVFDALPNLSYVSVSGSRLSSLPPSLLRRPLVKLWLLRNRFERLPVELWQMPNLVELNVSSNPITALGEGLTEEVARKCELRQIIANETKVQYIHPLLLLMPKLNLCRLEHCKGLRRLNFEELLLRPAQMWAYVKSYKTPKARLVRFYGTVHRDSEAHCLDMWTQQGDGEWLRLSWKFSDIAPHWTAQTRKIWQLAARQAWSNAQRDELLRWVANPKVLPAERHSLLQACVLENDSQLSALLYEALAAYSRQDLQAKPLTEQSHVAWLGDLPFDVKAMGHWGQFFAQNTRAISSKTTHAVVGLPMKPKDIEALQAQGIAIVSWEYMVRYLRERGVFDLLQHTEQKKDAIANVEAMLTSGDESTALLGLSLLATAGVPMQLVEALAGVVSWNMYFWGNDTISKQARQLLRIFTTMTHVRAAGEVIMRHYTQEEWAKLMKACKKGIFDLQRLLPVLDKMGADYPFFYWDWLAKHDKPRLREAAHEYLQRSGGKLSYALLKVTKGEICDMQELRVLDCSEEDDFPMQLPHILLRCEHLQHLILANQRIYGVSQTLEQLKNLRILDISYTHIYALPKVLLQTPHIREIRCAQTPFANTWYDKLQNGEKIKEADIFDLSQLPDKILRRDA